MLKKIKVYVCIFFLAGSFFAPFLSLASGTEEDLAYFLELINEIRLDPFTSAEALGYDRAVLAETFPWLKASYAPCVMDDFLSSRAEARNSLDGEIPEPEISPEHDYVRTGETGAAVSFLNFMPLKTAFRIIVENLLKQELNPDRVGPLNLLGTDFDRVGVSVRSGVQAFGDSRQNAYFVTICFGSSLLKSELQVLTMVNQVRSQPFSVLDRPGVSLTALLDNNRYVLHALFSNYSPLKESSILHGSAQNYSRALTGTGDDPSLLQDSTPLTRALDRGYDGFEVNESVALTTHAADEDSARIADRVFSSLVLDELYGWPEKSVVFCRDASDAGVGICFVPGEDTYNSFSVLDVGKRDSAEYEKSYVYGVVYSDTDGNGLYSPGEGQGGEPVVIFRKADNVIVRQIVTDIAGHFSVTLVNAQEYRVEISAGETMESLEMLIDQDLFLPVELKSLPVSP